MLRVKVVLAVVLMMGSLFGVMSNSQDYLSSTLPPSLEWLLEELGLSCFIREHSFDISGCTRSAREHPGSVAISSSSSPLPTPTSYTYPIWPTFTPMPPGVTVTPTPLGPSDVTPTPWNLPTATPTPFVP